METAQRKKWIFLAAHFTAPAVIHNEGNERRGTLALHIELDIEEQYDKIYRYCYYRLRNREQAEDVTQETFLRWFSSDTYRNNGQVLQYLYTIARNRCIDESRKPIFEILAEDIPVTDSDPILSIALRTELDKLSGEDRELVLLRYVNEVPVGVLCKLYGISRFAIYRRLRNALKKLQNGLMEE